MKTSSSSSNHFSHLLKFSRNLSLKVRWTQKETFETKPPTVNDLAISPSPPPHPPRGTEFFNSQKYFSLEKKHPDSPWWCKKSPPLRTASDGELHAGFREERKKLAYVHANFRTDKMGFFADFLQGVEYLRQYLSWRPVQMRMEIVKQPKSRYSRICRLKNICKKELSRTGNLVSYQIVNTSGFVRKWVKKNSGHSLNAHKRF